MKKINIIFWLLVATTFQMMGAEVNVSTADYLTAFGSAVDGDVLILESGLYAQGLTMPTDKTITLKAASNADVKIAFSISASTTDTNGGIIFDGVTIQPTSDYFLSGDPGNITTLAFRNSTITGVNRCLVRANTEGYTITKIEFTNCVISNCGNNGWNFIYVKHGVNTVEVKNCTLYNYTGGESFFFANATVADNVLNFVFENNTVYKWAKSSDRALCNVQSKYSASSTFTFRNNIVTEPGVVGAVPKMLVATGGTLTSENNLIVNYGAYESHTAAATQTITDLTLEGLGLTAIGFPDADNGDFSILSTSVLATAGKDDAKLGDPRWIVTLAEPVELTTANSPVAGGSVSPLSGAYEKGESATVTATANYGYRFKEWQNESGTVLSTENPYTFNINADLTITAVFSTVEMFTLTINQDGDGASWGKVSLSPEVKNNSYETGTIVDITVVPNSVTSFLYWEDSSNELTRQVQMDKAIDVTATFDVVPFIVGWDFTPLDVRGNRPGDYAFTTDNTGLLNLYNGNGNITNWGGSTRTFDGVTYNCARRYTDAADMAANPRYFIAKFSGAGYSSIEIKSKVGIDNTCVHSTQKMQYSTDGVSYTDLATLDVSTSVNTAWVEFNAVLPTTLTEEEKADIYIRWIPDVTSSLIGAASGTEGFYLAEVFAYAEQIIVDDTEAPLLVSTVPAASANTASANGSIIFTFNEKMKAGAGTIEFNGTTVSPVFGSKTVSIPYSGLSYGTNYSITIAANALTDVSGNAYAGTTLSFSTMNRPQPIARLYDAVVALDGSGDYTTVQAAIDAAPTNRTSPWLIFIKKGTYNELVRIPADKPYMYLIGQDKAQTIITFAICCSAGPTDSGWDYNKEQFGMSDCAVVVASASDFYAENISFINKYGVDFQNGPMALAMRTRNDRFAFYNCDFRSFQDTWYTTTNNISDRHYVYKCYFEGAVDYIYGSGDVFMDSCTMYNMRSGAVIVAPAHNEGTKFGYVFNNCTVDGNSAAADGGLKLGRPWHNAPMAVYLNTTMKILPAAEGWTNMGVIPKLFAEYNSMDVNGNPIDLSNRKDTYTESAGEGGETISGLQTVLSQTEAANYSYENVITGKDNWNPKAYFEPVAKPTNLCATNNELCWDVSDYAICYVVLRNSEVIGFTTEAAYTDENAVNQVEYTYTVKAVNEFGSISLASEEVKGGIGLAVANKQVNRPIVTVENSVLKITNLNEKTNISLVSINGEMIMNKEINDVMFTKTLPLLTGIYIVTVNRINYKVVF